MSITVTVIWHFLDNDPMKKVIIILTLIFSTSLFAQEDGQKEIVFSRIGNLTDEQINSSGPVKLLFAKKSEIRNLAKQDIENGIPFSISTRRNCTSNDSY